MQAAEGLRVVIKDSTYYLSPRSTSTKINPLWRQRLFHQAFPLLRAQSSGTSCSSPAVLLAICNLAGAMPKSVIQADIDSIIPLVLQVSERE